jgi:hypothetical protein
LDTSGVGASRRGCRRTVCHQRHLLLQAHCQPEAAFLENGAK